MTVFAKFSEFLSFSDLPENFDFGPFSSQIPDREVYLMPSNLMILLVLPYIYHLLQKLKLIFEAPDFEKIFRKSSLEKMLTSAKQWRHTF